MMNNHSFQTVVFNGADGAPVEDAYCSKCAVWKSRVLQGCPFVDEPLLPHSEAGNDSYEFFI